MKPFLKRFCIRLLSFLLILGILVATTLGHPDHVDHTDEEIGAMDIDSLVHVEHDLRSQNGIIDKHIASLHGRLTNLKKRQDLLERTERHVSHAKDWESRQKRARQKELERAIAELDAKKNQIRMLQTEARRLKEEIRELHDAMRALNLDKTKLEDQYLHPSLDAILIHEAERMGSLPQHILNKTITNIIPEVEQGFHEVLAIQEKFPHNSTLIAMLTSFCIYILALSVLYITFTFLRSLNSLFTLTRILFTIDMAFAFTWIFSCFLFVILFDDPFGMMAKRHGGLTVIVQIVLIGALLANIILRCISLSLQFGKISFIELLCTVFTAQHYYQSVWRPCLMDEELTTTSGIYFMYFLISAGLAVYRARSSGRGLEEVQDLCGRGSLSFLHKGSWFRMKMERTLKYCEGLLSGPSKQEDVSLRVEPQYYRETRHPEFSKRKGRSLDGKTRQGKKSVGHRQ